MPKFEGRLEVLSISAVHQHPDNIREDLGDLTQLAAELKTIGLISPLVVYPHPTRAGDFVVQDGNRRRAAAVLAGLTEVPCVVLPEPTRGAKADVEAMLTTGRNHRLLSEAEVSHGVQTLLDLGLDVTTIGKKLKMSRTEIKARAKLAERKDELAHAFTTGATSLDVVQRLYELEEKSGDVELYERTIKNLPDNADLDQVEKVIVDTEAKVLGERNRAELNDLGAEEAPMHAPWAKSTWEEISDERSFAEHHEAGHKYYFDYRAAVPRWFLEKEAPEPTPAREPSVEEIADREEQIRLNQALAKLQGVRMKSMVRRLQDRQQVREADAREIMAKQILSFEDDSRDEVIGMIIANPPVDGRGIDEDEFEAAEAKWRDNALKFLVKLPLANLVVINELLEFEPVELDSLDGFQRWTSECEKYGYKRPWQTSNFNFYGLLVNQLGYQLDVAEVEAMEYCAKREPGRNRELDFMDFTELDDACQSCGTEPFEPTGATICTGCASAESEAN